MILGKMILIPKDKKKSLCSSSNYMIIDWIILIKEQESLCSSDLQFGFKRDTPATQCTYSILETINYYNYNRKLLIGLIMHCIYTCGKYCSRSEWDVGCWSFYTNTINGHIIPTRRRDAGILVQNQSLRV